MSQFVRGPHPQEVRGAVPIALQVSLVFAGAVVLAVGVYVSPQWAALVWPPTPMPAIIACRGAFPGATPVECGCAAWAMPTPGPSRWDAREELCKSQGEAGWPTGGE